MSSTPVISAPVLKFPIQGYGAATPTAADTSSQPSKKAPSSAPAANESLLTPELEATMLSTPNFRDLPQETRLQLLQGPITRLVFDEETSITIPFRLLLTASQTVQNLHTHHGSTTPAIIKFKSLDHAAARKLITYLQDTASKWNCFYLKSSTLVDDLKLLHAASVLGIEAYVRNIETHWLNVIKPVKWTPTPADLRAVEHFCPAGLEDRVFKATALRVAHCVVDGYMSGADIAELPKLAAAVERIVGGLVAQKVLREEKREQRVRIQQAWAKEKKEKREAGEQRVKDREEVLGILNANGGVKVVTAEQAELLRRR